MVVIHPIEQAIPELNMRYAQKKKIYQPENFKGFTFEKEDDHHWALKFFGYTFLTQTGVEYTKELEEKMSEKVDDIDTILIIFNHKLQKAQY